MIFRKAMPGFPSVVLAQNPTTNHPKNKKLGGAPVVFSAQTTLRTGQSAVLNAQTLQSGFRTPYFIDEIRISLLSSQFTTAATLTGLSGLVSVLFQTGSYMFSNDAVPVGLLAPIFGTDYGTVMVSNNGGVGDAVRGSSTVRWMLPKPLFMPAGDVVLANVSLNDSALGILNTLFTNDPAVRVTITYVGRLVPQGFEVSHRAVPWLAWWTKSLNEEYKTANTRLRNPFVNPAHVQRFTSRTYESSIASYNEVPLAAQAPTSAAYESIHISDSRGYQITNTRVPIGHVFDTARHAWTFGRELGPREQFNMEMVTENFSGGEFDPDYITNVGLVGYRKESL